MAKRKDSKRVIIPGDTTSRKNSPRVPIIDDDTPNEELFAPIVDGEVKAHGLVERDHAAYPEEMFDPPSDIPLIPRSEWPARIKEMEEKKSRLSDIRGDIPSLDQNGQGFCWAYSTTACVMLLRALNNQPYVRLSAHAIACKIMKFQDRGGWCGLSAKYHREHGCPSIQHWPEKSMSRSHDTPETWENAAKHIVTEDWVDLTRKVYDQNLTFDQMMTCLLNRIPCALDFGWWGHSVCGMDPVEVEPGSFGEMIWNSWTDRWGSNGTGILRGSRAIPGGAVALRVTGASPD